VIEEERRDDAFLDERVGDNIGVERDALMIDGGGIDAGEDSSA
jgi:hypothetical protein